MDITLQELKTMKAKQLRRIIREAIEEVLSEQSPTEKAAKDAEIKALQAKKKAIDAKLGDIASGREDMAEGELDEAKTYSIADPNFDTSAFANKSIRGTAVSDMLDWIKANPGVSARRFKEQFGFPKEQGANAFLNAFHQSGILTKLDSGGQEITARQPGVAGEEESEEVVTGPEAFLIGSGDLSKYFTSDSNDNAGDEEDFNAEEEPTAGEIGGQPVSTSSMSDEDYEAFMKYDELKQRLDSTKSNILKMKRSKGGVAGDIKDTSSSDIERLQALKTSLQSKIDALVASSDYLKKKTGQEITAAPEIEDVENEETLEEYNDRMYEIRKLQYYAGIRK
jgi:hypothetical protein